MPIAAHDFLQDDEFEEFAEEGKSLLILLHICSSPAPPAMRAVCITPPSKTFLLNVFLTDWPEPGDGTDKDLVQYWQEDWDNGNRLRILKLLYCVCVYARSLVCEYIRTHHKVAVYSSPPASSSKYNAFLRGC